MSPSEAIQSRIESLNLDLLCDILASETYQQLFTSRKPNWKEDWDLFGESKEAENSIYGQC